MQRSRLAFDDARTLWEARDVYRVKAALRGIVMLFFGLEFFGYATVGYWYLGLVVIGDSGNAVLRTYGPGESAGERLRRHLAGWVGAGRPGVDRLRVTSLPAQVVPRPRQGDLLLRRPSTTLVLSPLRI